ncbi:MAG: hypothetical protein N2595_10355 [bacterium]|nr:hypothetical protein [bacterium]
MGIIAEEAWARQARRWDGEEWAAFWGGGGGHGDLFLRRWGDGEAAAFR